MANLASRALGLDGNCYIDLMAKRNYKGTRNCNLNESPMKLSLISHPVTLGVFLERVWNTTLIQLP